MLDREGGKWRALPGSGGGREGGKDGTSNNALLAPRAFTTAEKRRQTVRTRTPSPTLT